MSPSRLGEAIILAGGFGTRLRTVVNDRPKPLAPVAGRPFVHHLLDRLAAAGVKRVVMAVGYMADMVIDQLGPEYAGMALRYSIEAEPLGTGGGIRQALSGIEASEVLVMNGDSIVDLDYHDLAAGLDKASDAALAIALRRVDDAGRYGVVNTERARVTDFAARRDGHGSALINAGVYLLRRDIFDRVAPPGEAFSFERDYIEAHVRELRPVAVETDGFFIDIGIPEDFARAQTLLS